MPTGYTSAIYEGEEVGVSEYILKCARAFGATISMRDKPLDKEITEFKPSTYNLDSISRAEKRLNEIEAMTIDEANKRADEAYQSSLSDYHETLNKKRCLRSRYESLLQKVKEWIPPTEEHIKLKEFSIEQLTKSIEWDCNEEYMNPPTRFSGEDYIEAGINGALQDIAYHQKAHYEEVKRISERNLWVKNLKDSL
ncbi:hypothetical protein MHB54_00575 [Paenibacillus sp. FSL M7-0802]|uniref:hypothetical protein n=1 Tax=Paenibacillus sp. FSL M7-0802 TaxID=2921536 RepID=UPI0030F5518C